MIETLALFSTILLITLIYELTSVHTREWGENSKSFF